MGFIALSCANPEMKVNGRTTTSVIRQINIIDRTVFGLFMVGINPVMAISRANTSSVELITRNKGHTLASDS